MTEPPSGPSDMGRVRHVMGDTAPVSPPSWPWATGRATDRRAAMSVAAPEGRAMRDAALSAAVRGGSGDDVAPRPGVPGVKDRRRVTGRRQGTARGGLTRTGVTPARRGGPFDGDVTAGAVGGVAAPSVPEGRRGVVGAEVRGSMGSRRGMRLRATGRVVRVVCGEVVCGAVRRWDDVVRSGVVLVSWVIEARRSEAMETLVSWVMETRVSWVIEARRSGVVLLVMDPIGGKARLSRGETDPRTLPML